MFSIPSAFEPTIAFNLIHIATFVICIFLAVAFVGLNKDKEYLNIKNQFKIFAVVLTVLELVGIIWSWCVGLFNINYWLPLSFGGLFIVVLWIASFAKGRVENFAQSVISMIGVGGGIIGLVWNIYHVYYPVFHFQVIRSMLLYTFMIYAGLLVIIKKYNQVKNHCIKNYSIVCALVLILSVIFGINFDGNIIFIFNQNIPFIWQGFYSVFIIICYFAIAPVTKLIIDYFTNDKPVSKLTHR